MNAALQETPTTSRTPSDAALVQAARGGDQRAFRTLVDRHQTLACSVAYAVTRSLGESEEIAQEAFVAAWRGLGGLRDPGQFRPWLSGIVRNLARHARRRRRRRPEVAGSPAVMAAPGPSPLERAISAEEEVVLAEALARLPESYRVPLVLYYREERSLPEVARLLDLSEDNVRQRLSRGRKQLASATSRVEDALARTRPSKTFGAAVMLLVAAASAGARAATGGGLRGSLTRWTARRVAAVAGGAAVVASVVAGLAIHRSPDAARRAAAGAAAERALAVTARLRRPPLFFETDPGAPAAALEGTVRDGDGKAVEGALVAAVPRLDVDGTAARLRPAAVGLSGPGGHFRLAPLAGGDYGVTATRDGYRPAHEPGLRVGPGARREDLILTIVRGGSTVTGRVLDAAAGAVPGAEVLAPPGPERTDLYLTTADAAGRYRLTLPAGPRVLIADAEGYAPSATSIGGDGGETADLFLSPAAQASGRVVERGSGRPVAGAEVLVRQGVLGWAAVTRRRMTTDVDGQFALRDLDAGSYSLLARSGDQAGRLRDDLLVTGPDQHAHAVIEVEPGAALAGVIRTAEGRPVPGATVVLRGSALDTEALLRTASAADGSFAFRGVLPGRFVVVARAAGHAPADTETAVVPGRDPAPLALVLSPEAVLRARVVSAAGAPVAGAEVTITPMNPGPPFAARTGADGVVACGGLPAGSVTVSAGHAAHGWASADEITLRAAERREITLVLRPGAVVAGQVRWNDGTAAGGVTVIALAGPGTVVTARTGSDGHYTLGPLPAGAVTLFASRKEGLAGMFSEGILPDDLARPGSRVTLRVTANEARRDLDLPLVRGGVSIRGVVRAADGAAVAGARVVAEEQSLGTGGTILRLIQRGMGATLGPMGPPSGLSDAEGRFAIDDLLPGKYLVRASFPGMPDVELGAVRAGRGEVQLRFPEGVAVTGTVVRADGSPVSDGELVVRRAGEAAETTPAAAAELLASAARLVVHDPRGGFRLSALAAGRYELRFTDAAGDAGKQAIDVSGGTPPHEVRLVVAPGGTVTGRVIDEREGTPLAAATVGVVGAGEMFARTSGADGRFTVQGLIPGDPIHLVIGHQGHTSATRELALPAAGTHDLGDVRLAPAPSRP